MRFWRGLTQKRSTTPQILQPFANRNASGSRSGTHAQFKNASTKPSAHVFRLWETTRSRKETRLMTLRPNWKLSSARLNEMSKTDWLTKKPQLQQSRKLNAKQQWRNAMRKLTRLSATAPMFLAR